MRLPAVGAPKMHQVDNLLDYGRYAVGYDRLCDLSPAYQELRALLNKFIPTFFLSPDAKVCDLGAGTGNFTLEVAAQYPCAEFTHVDMSTEMNEAARRKYRDAGLNFTIHEALIQICELPEDHFDLIIMVNALNTCPPQFQVLQKVYRWLKPGGHFFVIDFGREQDTWDWTRYLSKTVYASHGFFGLLRELWMNREAIRQNRRARHDQENGTMWLHSTENFGAMIDKAGFYTEHIQPCYRGYCDLVVAAKPHKLPEVSR
jgi:ubiquinone/menaquinone biosynthesis C-methylase UbiE